jgi:DNA-binding HxlR family transcriptional regulator
MLPRTYDQQMCPVARVMEVIGDRWTLLIIRDVFQRLHRFQQLEASLGLSRHVLSERLERLVEDGIFERRRYQERPERFEYHLTEKGRGLWKLLAQITLWGDEHYPAPAGRHREIRHVGCGGAMDDRFHCQACGQELDAGDLDVAMGPGLLAVAAETDSPYPWRRRRGA